MTSKRRLKKEIDYVVSDLILVCITYSNLYKKSDDQDALLIVQDTLLLRNSLRNKANHPEQRENSETAKCYYNNIAKDLIDGVEKGFAKLGTLINKDV